MCAFLTAAAAAAAAVSAGKKGGKKVKKPPAFMPKVTWPYPLYGLANIKLEKKKRAAKKKAK